MKEKLEAILTEAISKFAEAKDIRALNDARVKYLGKQGELTLILRGMKDVPAKERPEIGSLVNEVRNKLEEKIQTKQNELEEKQLLSALQSEKIDITEPAKGNPIGAMHPLNRTFNILIDACVEMGFKVITGPEIETDYYNFEALNLPKDHPARDMQDSFYITENFLLRTQTSSVQIHAMENIKPPFKVVAPGRVYRVDNDPTHTPVFHQLEGLVIDENVSMTDLKACLTKLLRILYGEETELRFRPSFFPFTEPSVEVDATCMNCKGKGCRLCKETGFIELLGAGMVNPKVLENAGIDSKKYRGFAFGFGVDRMSMLVHRITDLRMCFENDKRFLDQLR